MRNPNVPESLEGWWILHRMFAFNRRQWSRVPAASRERMQREAVETLKDLKGSGDCGLAQIAGHKADLMVTHYAKTYEGLPSAQARFDVLELADHLEPRDSYVSVLELGLYDASAKIHAALAERALKPYSNEWNDAFDAMLGEQQANPRNFERLWARIPERRYVCFYPMDKKREGADNWYMLPYGDRGRMMLEHGKVGRTYHGMVNQVISGSIGFDDYEWGVDLYADDPLVFKKLIYEMRFDEASARYALFGPFWSGLQFSIDALPRFLAGEVSALNDKATA